MATPSEIGELMAQWRTLVAARPRWGSVDLTLTQLRALSAIARRQPLRLSDLAGELGVGLGAASTLVDRIERRGLLTRRPDERDRRTVRLEVSSRGRRLLERLEQGRTERLGRLIERMTPEERDALATVLRAFVRLGVEHPVKKGPHGLVVVQKDAS